MADESKPEEKKDEPQGRVGGPFAGTADDAEAYIKAFEGEKPKPDKAAGDLEKGT